MKSLKWIFTLLTACFVLVSLPATANTKVPSADVVYADKVHKVDINTADAKTLAQALKGIGLKRARAIVAYREQNGPFVSIDDLQKVKGIGTSTIKRNADVVEY